MRELDKVLDDKEKVLWEGVPQLLPFLFGGVALVLFGLVFLVIGGIVAIGGIMSGNLFFIFVPHFWIGVAIVFGLPLYQWLVHSRTHYAITNKRAIIQTGLIGRDFQMVDFDQISNAEVNVGIIDKIFGKDSGSILISTAGTFVQGKHGPIAKPYVLSNISNPYEVFKFFKKVSHAVKTDINYPNEYRPKKNKGYNTDLDLK